MLPAIRKHAFVPGSTDPFFGSHLLSSFFSDGADYTVPAVNIKENDKVFEIEIAAPGLNKEDIRIQLEKDVLTVSSDKKTSKEEQDDHFMRREFSFNAFSRSFSVPESVNNNKIKASHENGVLKIELPKLEKEAIHKSKTIKIS